MFFTEVGFSSFETADPPSGLTGILAHPGESDPAVNGPTIATRLLAVAAIVCVSLVLHVVGLVIAERTYAPYRVSRSGEYVQSSTIAGVAAPRLAAVASHHHQLPRRP